MEEAGVKSVERKIHIWEMWKSTKSNVCHINLRCTFLAVVHSAKISSHMNQTPIVESNSNAAVDEMTMQHECAIFSRRYDDKYVGFFCQAASIAFAAEISIEVDFGCMLPMSKVWPNSISASWNSIHSCGINRRIIFYQWGSDYGRSSSLQLCIIRHSDSLIFASSNWIKCEYFLDVYHSAGIIDWINHQFLAWNMDVCEWLECKIGFFNQKCPWKLWMCICVNTNANQTNDRIKYSMAFDEGTCSMEIAKGKMVKLVSRFSAGVTSFRQSKSIEMIDFFVPENTFKLWKFSWSNWVAADTEFFCIFFWCCLCHEHPEPKTEDGWC